MILRLEKGEIALPKDYKFEITSNHPFFSNDGTATTPSTLPPSPENRGLLGYPENPNRAKRYSKQYPATLSHGIFFKRCRLVVEGGSAAAGIPSSLALQESEMYAKVQDRKMPDVFEDPITLSAGISYVLDTYSHPTTGLMVILPVAADVVDADTPDATGSTRRISTILNEYSNGSLVTSGKTIVRHEKEISAPNYYGIAPFFFLHYVIRQTFVRCEYSVAENVFETDPVLSKIIMLHNTADVMVGSAIDSSHTLIRAADMVPSITVGEFIEWLRDKFGAFVSVKGRTVSIRLFRDICQTSPDLDLSPYMREEYSLVYPEPRSLRYGCTHSIEGSEPAADTFEKLRASYSSRSTVLSTGDMQGTGLFHVLPLGKYYYKNVADDKISTAMIGTDSFDYSRKIDMATEEISTDDDFVPMVQHSGEYMPFIGDTIRRHVDTDDKDATAEQAIMLCYARYNASRNYGSCYAFDPSGSQVNDNLPDLTPEGIVPEFLAEYQDILLDGAPTISCKLDIPLHMLVSMDSWTPKIIRGAKALIKSLKYSISDSGLSTIDAELQLLPSYVDAVRVSDPEFGTAYEWNLVNTRSIFEREDGPYHTGAIEILETDGLTDYTQADAPAYVPTQPNIIAKSRSRWLRYSQHTGNYTHPAGHGETETEEIWRTYTHEYTEYFISSNE